jgi:MFS family permease
MSAVRLLRRRGPFGRLCAAVAISQVGDWLLFIALPLYVLHASGSALDTSTVFLAELLPAVVVGGLLGPLVDRAPPGRLLAGMSAAQAALMIPLLAVAPGRLWLIYVVAGLQAAATSLTLPAQQAAVPGLVAPDTLPTANATVEMASNAARLIGGPLGGLLLGLLGLRALVGLDLVSFLIAAALLAGVGQVARRRREPGGGRSQRAGWRAVRRSSTLRAAMAIAFVGAVAQGLFLVLYVLFVVRSLHDTDQVVGLLRGVQAIGGVLGGVVVGAWAARLGARTLAVGGLAMFGVLSLVTWNSPAITTAAWWYVLLFIAVGLPATALATGLLTGTQAASPAHARGHVLSLMGVADALGQGTGILAAGLLAAHVTLGALLDLQAGCYLACAVVAAVAFARPGRTVASLIGGGA